MTVPPQGGQNSAYRSGCHKFLFSITYRTPDPVVTPVWRTWTVSDASSVFVC